MLKINPALVYKFIDIVDYQDGSIVSREVIKKSSGTITVFAFDAGQGLSGHSSPMDAYVQILEGNMEITIGEEKFALGSGEVILMPAMINHALDALESSKMLLTMVRV